MWTTIILLILIKHFHVITGKVCLTFFGQWSEVQSEICSKAMEQMYCAPGENMHAVVGRNQWLFLGVTCHLVARFSWSTFETKYCTLYGNIKKCCA